MQAFRRIMLPLLALAGAGVPASADEVIRIGGREVLVDGATEVIVDGEPWPAGVPLPRRPGMRSEVRFAPTGASTPSGVGEPAQVVVFSYALRGPVTAVSPLRVLGQEVAVDGGTGSIGLPGGSIGNVKVGHHLDVSGFVDVNGSLRASFLEFSPEPIARWLLSGYVTAVNAGAATADLGLQRISLAGVAPVDCGAALAPGQFVEIRADANPGFGAGSTLGSISSLRCVAPMPLGTPGALGALQGLVGAPIGDNSFRFGPYVVNWTADTEFRFGVAGDLVEGAAIEVDGVFGDALVFDALGIQFDAPPVRLEGPVAPVDVVPGPQGTVRLLDNTLGRSAQLRDDDAIYASGLAVTRQVELRGYLDRNGQRWATRARTRGNPDLADARVGGPVDVAAPPLYEVLGITLDTTGATFEGPDGGPISAAEFHAQAGVGAQIEHSGSYAPAELRMSGGVVALLLPPQPPAAPAQVDLLVARLEVVERLFADGFEAP